MKEQDKFILDIKRIGINGEGIGFYNKMAIFVPNAIPGEGHEVEITKCDKKMAFAKTTLLKNPSKDRKIPECPYYSECGACQTMHINYTQMLKFKKELIVEALSRYTTLNSRSFEIRDVVASPEEFGYRNRSQLVVKTNVDESSVCMIKENSNNIIFIDECMVNKPLINDLNKQITKILDKLEIKPYFKNNDGLIRYLTIRVNQKNEALVCFVCYKDDEKLKELGREVIKLNGVKSVYVNYNNNTKTNNIYGKNTILLEGNEYIIETLGKIKYQIGPTTFFQLNSKQAEAMYNQILKAAKLSFKETVLDAYCGVGSIGLYLAKMAKEVVGIELNEDSVLAANSNAKLNKISNAKFLQGDSKALLPKLIADGYQFDVIVADPPRTGLTEEFIKTILDSNIKRFVYVSCNPSTLAKDLELLKEKYNVNSITPFDMFPNTSLVESVCTLSLKSK